MAGGQSLLHIATQQQTDSYIFQKAHLIPSANYFFGAVHGDLVADASCLAIKVSLPQCRPRGRKAAGKPCLCFTP
jgi:hypothetical protein